MILLIISHFRLIVISLFSLSNTVPAYIPQAKAWGLGGKIDNSRTYPICLLMSTYGTHAAGEVLNLASKGRCVSPEK